MLDLILSCWMLHALSIFLESSTVSSLYCSRRAQGTGSGDAHTPANSDLILRPGRSYFLPEHAAPMTLTVNQQQRGPLRVAIAHENLHLADPTSIGSRDPTAADTPPTDCA